MSADCADELAANKTAEIKIVFFKFAPIKTGIKNIKSGSIIPEYRRRIIAPLQHPKVYRRRRMANEGSFRAPVVWVMTATSLPSSVSSRVCQTCVRRPRWTGSPYRNGRACLGADKVGLAFDGGGSLGVRRQVDHGRRRAGNRRRPSPRRHGSCAKGAEVFPDHHGRHHLVRLGLREGHSHQNSKRHRP